MTRLPSQKLEKLYKKREELEKQAAYFEIKIKLLTETCIRGASVRTTQNLTEAIRSRKLISEDYEKINDEIDRLLDLDL